MIKIIQKLIFKISLRGFGSLNPLYYIDGVKENLNINKL
jgi:hypothetical protein